MISERPSYGVPSFSIPTYRSCPCRTSALLPQGADFLLPSLTDFCWKFPGLPKGTETQSVVALSQPLSMRVGKQFAMIVIRLR